MPKEQHRTLSEDVGNIYRSSFLSFLLPFFIFLSTAPFVRVFNFQFSHLSRLLFTVFIFIFIELPFYAAQQLVTNAHTLCENIICDGEELRKLTIDLIPPASLPVRLPSQFPPPPTLISSRAKIYFQIAEKYERISHEKFLQRLVCDEMYRSLRVCHQNNKKKQWKFIWIWHDEKIEITMICEKKNVTDSQRIRGEKNVHHEHKRMESEENNLRKKKKKK